MDEVAIAAQGIFDYLWLEGIRGRVGGNGFVNAKGNGGKIILQRENA